jgi:hypothetical protein
LNAASLLRVALNGAAGSVFGLAAFALCCRMVRR